jgi:hypothetical protein
MKNEYTRQRQGKDFTEQQKIDDTHKSMLDRLEQFKTEAERNLTPIDGHEPPEVRR